MIRTKIKYLVAEEMAQQVRAMAALLEDLVRFLEPTSRLTTPGQNAPAGTRHPRGAQTCKQVKQPDTYIKHKLIKLKTKSPPSNT